MVRNALRKELAALLTAPAGNRQPVIRRSLTEAWLYATDLPALFGGNLPHGVLSALKATGWAFLEENGWLLLKKTAKEPPAGWYDGTFGPEAACCLSLLRRHGQRIPDPERRTERMLVKAGEEGSDAYERACKTIHAEWAVLLRKGRMIPDMDPGFFGEGTIC